MPVPTDELTRLSTGAPTGYNNDPYNASTNPYGFADGGYITNFFAALNDLTVVSLWVTDEIAPLVDITTEIEALGAIVADLSALTAIIPDISALAALDTQITALGAITADITTVATNAASVTAVATDIAKVAAVEAALSDIEAVSAALTNISTVVGMAADIATLVARATDIATLADIEDGTEATGAISAVAGIATAVSNVSTNSAAVVAVAGDLSDINTLAGISADVTAAGAVADDIAAVASISADVQTVADNIADVQAAPAAAVAARKSVRHIIFDSGTADAHPGAGHFRLSFDINAATVGTTGFIYQDLADADGGTQTGFIDSWDDVINATGRGNISIVGESDPSISALLRVTGAVTNGTLYKKAPITLLNKSVVGGSFADEAEFTQSFEANGNDGDAIGGGATIIGAVTAGDLLQAIDDSTMESSGKTVADFFDLGANDLDDVPDGSTYAKATGAELTKLAGIEAAADVTDAGNVGSSIAGSSNKATPVSADRFAILDSASGNALAYSTHAQVLATFQTSFDSRYSQTTHIHAWADITGRPDALVSIGGLTPAANKIPYYTGASTAALADFPASARTAFTAGFSTDVLALLDDANFAAMRTSLGLAIGTNVQAYDADLAAIAGLTSAANKGIQFTGSGTAATYDLTAFAKTILDDADAATARDTLGIPKATFCAHKNGTNQTGIASATYTKLTFTTEDFDVGSYFDTSTSRWTPPAGKYRIEAQAVFTGGVVVSELYAVAIYKNGASIASSLENSSNVIGVSSAISKLIEANGTDYFEIYAYGGGTGNKTIGGLSAQSWFCGSPA